MMPELLLLAEATAFDIFRLFSRFWICDMSTLFEFLPMMPGPLITLGGYTCEIGALLADWSLVLWDYAVPTCFEE